MQDLEIKEKALCALRKNADRISPDKYLYQNGFHIWMSIKHLYKETRHGFFVFSYITKEYNGYVVEVSVNDSIVFNITSEEFEEIMKIREEKIRERLIKELDKLCKNN